MMSFVSQWTILMLPLQKTGAVKGAESVKVDLNAGREEDIENLEAFAKSLVSMLS